MKISFPLIAGSLAVNAIFAAILIFWKPSQTNSKNAAAAAASSHPPESISPSVQKRSGLANGGTLAAGKTWEHLFNGNLTTLPQRLRAAGFPPATVRAIVSALVDEKFSSRRRSIEAETQQPYWKSRSNAYDPKAQNELNALGREEGELLGKLLGPDPDDGVRNYARAQMIQEFGRELSPETLKRVRDLQRTSSDFYSEISAKVGPNGAYLPSDMEKMRALQNQLHGDLAKVLSPDELFEYDLRNSSTASSLRYTLGALHPTEAEFRALFPFYRSLDEQYPLKSGMTTQEEMAPRQAAEKALQEQIKMSLGADRYAELEMARDYNYQQTSKVTDRLGLPTTTTAQVYEMQKEIQQRANVLRSDRKLSADERTIQLANLATEAGTKISGVLGTSGFEAYREYAGQWLQQLQPRPRAVPKAP